MNSNYYYMSTVNSIKIWSQYFLTVVP